MICVPAIGQSLKEAKLWKQTIMMQLNDPVGSLGLCNVDVDDILFLFSHAIY